MTLNCGIVFSNRVCKFHAFGSGSLRGEQFSKGSEGLEFKTWLIDLVSTY